MKKILFAVIATLALVSCTDQQSAKKYGGTAVIDIPKGEKLINVTWKGESDIWYLTRPMTEKDSAETYTFHQEKGAVLTFHGNGTVILKESK
jgi:uncharacterized lipoprotein YehR (DUF1307 family)